MRSPVRTNASFVHISPTRVRRAFSDWTVADPRPSGLSEPTRFNLHPGTRVAKTRRLGPFRRTKRRNTLGPLRATAPFPPWSHPDLLQAASLAGFRASVPSPIGHPPVPSLTLFRSWTVARPGFGVLRAGPTGQQPSPVLLPSGRLDRCGFASGGEVAISPSPLLSGPPVQSPGGGYTPQILLWYNLTGVSFRSRDHPRYSPTVTSLIRTLVLLRMGPPARCNVHGPISHRHCFWFIGPEP